MQYQLGDMVQWSSQAAGHVKVKTGEALAVLPAKVAVHKVVKPILADGQHTSEIPGRRARSFTGLECRHCLS